MHFDSHLDKGLGFLIVVSFIVVDESKEVKPSLEEYLSSSLHDLKEIL
jgi:hypothetical protein